MPLGKSVHRPPGGGGHCGPGDRFVVAVRSRTDAAIARKRDAIDLSVPVTVALLGFGELDDVELTASTVEPGR